MLETSISLPAQSDTAPLNTSHRRGSMYEVIYAHPVWLHSRGHHGQTSTTSLIGALCSVCRPFRSGMNS